MLEAETFGSLGSDENKEYVEIIHNSGRHLHRIIGDILDLSKIEAGEEELVEEKVDLEEVIDEALGLVSGRASKKQMAFPVDISQNIPLLRADRLKVLQILINLQSNAIKFTPDGGEVGTEVTLNKDGGIQITVNDTGQGIRPEDIQKVMEPFSQSADAYTRSHEGTGLGLALVQSMMLLHGGTVTIESDVGKGTCVTLVFPSERTINPSRLT